jgi:hypothetical protein
MNNRERGLLPERVVSRPVLKHPPLQIAHYSLLIAQPPNNNPKEALIKWRNEN